MDTPRSVGSWGWPGRHWLEVASNQGRPCSYDGLISDLFRLRRERVAVAEEVRTLEVALMKLRAKDPDCKRKQTKDAFVLLREAKQYLAQQFDEPLGTYRAHLYLVYFRANGLDA